MILRIILSITLCIVLLAILFVIKVIGTIWKITSNTQYICAAFDEVFQRYLEEGVFSRDESEEITIVKVHLEFYNLEEACYGIEKYANTILKEYDKHTYLLKNSSFQEQRKKILEIKSRINWLRKKF